MTAAVKSLKKCKSPGNDGLSAEFYQHFWTILEQPLFNVFQSCVAKSELSSTMKQGTICLIPKPDKDPAFIENLCPITLLNLDYKIFASMFAKRLKSGLQEIISETQTGFMANRHISSNISLILDLLDYSDNIKTNSLILFLDFYKPFDTIEHHFLFKTLSSFGFGSNFINIIRMFYNNINSSVMMYPHTTNSQISNSKISPSGMPRRAFSVLVNCRTFINSY